ncbi:MAG: Isoleucine--tRNA ligase [bacterium ADurb.Bin243]|nr:MAG: Isoleucine--tRNA ligase [bacterium ADurb.Bin243]
MSKMIFDKVESQIKPERELDILKFWNDGRIFYKSMEEKKGSKPFVFHEGPPTANGMPHPGHVLTKVMKDLIPRYKTMCGHYVSRKAGWDTHGLPVELEVEKMLGINGKQEIEKYGVEAFIKKCRESVFKYEAEWRKMVDRGGFWVDMEAPYITCTNEYIETVWWALKRFFDEGYLYQGHKVIPYCPRCGTGLSSHEVAQGYEECEDPSVFVKFKVKNQENTYFLVWTTTPWTLISNVALAVHNDHDYVKVKTGDEYLILAKARLGELKSEYEIAAEYKGKDLVGTDYEQMFKFVRPDKKAHYVCAADFVTLEDGTGIVHIAPAFGEDDYQLGVKNGLPVIQPVNSRCEYTDEVTPWKGVFVKDADPSIQKFMKENGILYKSGKIKHTYPFCWRCDSPLIYYARHSWFIKATAFKDEILAQNDNINWYPDYIKTGRFKNFLENMIDWALSRDRYWGTPLPIWICESCKTTECIGSIEELKKKSDNCPDNIELHKPYVDEVTVKCSCGAKMKRVPEVIDCWFDSGMMHTAQWHYPFENKEKFGENFPADFICEAVDQTRGWFYSLLVTSTFLHKKSSYKNVVVLGLIQDKNGVKMSKSKGNIVDPFLMFNKYGADALRWCFYSGTSPWNARRFFEDAVMEAHNKFLGTIQNTYAFFTLYANIDNFNPLDHKIEVNKRPLIDQWIKSKFNRLVKKVREELDKFDIMPAAVAMEKFVEELSNWYVRRSRRRFWKFNLDDDKIAAYLTLYEILVDFSRLLAPFCPFITEQIYRNLVCRLDPKAKESVHLTDYPEYDEKINFEELESQMALIQNVVYMGRSARNACSIKVRQPIADMIVKTVSPHEKEVVLSMKELIDEELNVKNISFTSSLDDFVDYIVKPNFPALGAKYGKLVPEIKKYLETNPNNEIAKSINKSGEFKFEMAGQEIILTKENVAITSKSREKYSVLIDGEYGVALDTQLSEDLILEGYAREIINKVQNMRKEADFEILDKINISYGVIDEGKAAAIKACIEKFDDFIKSETLADNIFNDKTAADSKEWDINGVKMSIAVKKA